MPSNLRKEASLFSTMARGEKMVCSASTISGLALVHAEGGNLDDEHVGVFVHDQAAEKIAFGVDHAKGGGLGKMFLADGQRRADAPDKKVAVDLHPLRGKDADLDFGFGIVEADAEETLAMVLDLHQRAIGGGRGQAQNGGGVNPGMPGQDAVGIPRADDAQWAIGARSKFRFQGSRSATSSRQAGQHRAMLSASFRQRQT